MIYKQECNLNKTQTATVKFISDGGLSGKQFTSAFCISLTGVLM